MDIRIAKKGIAKGTIGWLAKGLADGSLIISEGTMQRTGNHGLWLTGTDGLSLFLAGCNQHGLSTSGMYGYDKANTYEIDDEFGEYGNIAITAACAATLKAIAQEWCDECNAALEDEQPLDIKIVRVDNIAQEVAA